MTAITAAVNALETALNTMRATRQPHARIATVEHAKRVLLTIAGEGTP